MISFQVAIDFSLKKHAISMKTRARCWKSYIKKLAYLCNLDNPYPKFTIVNKVSKRLF